MYALPTAMMQPLAPFALLLFMRVLAPSAGAARGRDPGPGQANGQFGLADHKLGSARAPEAALPACRLTPCHGLKDLRGFNSGVALLVAHDDYFAPSPCYPNIDSF